MTEFVHQGEILAAETTENSVQLQIRVPENLYYFQGHFPDIAILPGVVLTHWVMEYLNQYFDVDASLFTGLKGLKFQAIIRPNYELTLALTKLNDHKYSFNYSSTHGQHASGKVLFE